MGRRLEKLSRGGSRAYRSQAVRCSSCTFRGGRAPHTGLRAVLFQPHTGCAPEFFGFFIPEALADWWESRTGHAVLIDLAELLPICLARSTWGERLANVRLINFIDNDGARDHMISGYPKRGGGEHLVNCAWWLDAEFDIL